MTEAEKKRMLRSAGRSTWRDRLTPLDVVLVVILGLFAVIIIAPFFISIMISVSTPGEYYRKRFVIWPEVFTFRAYEQLMQNGTILRGYKNTLIHVAIGVPLSLFMTVCTGYVISRPRYPGRRLIFTVIMFTLIFGGGTVPTFLLVKQLGLINSRWAVILTNLVSTYNCVLMTSYLRTLPEALFESARIDGAGETTVLMRIALPLCKPIIATLGLFYLVGKWNEWFSSMLYLNNASMHPLQMILRTMIENVVESKEQTKEMAELKTFSMGMKMAAIIVTTVPVMLVYPFLQKYFMKGITLGAVK